MTLLEAVQKIQYDNSWAVYAVAPFTPESEARYGQTQFENGGILDDKEFFADGIQCGDAISDWCDGDTQNAEDWMVKEGAEQYISEREQWRKDYPVETL